MPEKNELKKTDKIEGQLQDEEILELADEVLGSSDDEIVELTDVSDISAGGDDEEIIDLSEVADIPVEEDEDIMDLTDTLDTPPAKDDGLTELSDIVAESPPPLEEDIIDLDDFADETPAAEEEIMDLEEMVDESPVPLSEEVPAVEAAKEAESLDLTDSDREAIADELSLDLDADTLGDTVELGDAVSDKTGQAPEETAELTTFDDDTGIDDISSPGTPEGESDTMDLTELDSESLDKELGELNLEFKDPGQTDTAEPTAEQEVLDLDNEVVDDTVEMRDIAQATPEPTEHPEQTEQAPADNFELTDADRDIIDEQLNLNLDAQHQSETDVTEDTAVNQEEELSLDLSAESLAKDSVVAGVESTFADEAPDQQPPETPPLSADEPVDRVDETQQDASGLDFEKEESFADSLGMTLDSETDTSEDWPQPEEPDDIYKTQEILDEISQFDTVEDSALHKQSDPISIKVQDPATENRLEIDSLEQDGSADLGSVSSEQIDLAVERVVKKMFADKIESVLVQVIEKTVSKEINKIKNILLDETSGDG